MGVIAYVWKVVAAWIAVILGISTNSEDILTLHRSGTTTWERYGRIFILVLRGCLESYYQIEHILQGDGDILLTYQQTAILDCNMIAVAAAIVSSVTVTTFQFPSLQAMHWAVSAAFVFSLIASLFCVYGACTLQRLVSNLSDVTQFRAWLSAPPRDPGYGDSKDNGREPNVATVLTLTAPKTLLDHSIRFFMIGLVGYLVCLHSMADESLNRESGSMPSSGISVIGSRNVIIVSTFSLCIGISLLISPSSYKNFKLAATRHLGIQDFIEGSTPSQSSKATMMKERRAFKSAGTTGFDISNDFEGSKAFERAPSNALDILQALHEAAAARERSAKADERVAEAYRQLMNRQS